MDKDLDELEENVNIEQKSKVDENQSSININENNENSETKSQKNEILAGIGIALGSILGVVLVTLLVLVIAGFQFYYVLTSSMSPTIYAGQTVLVNTNIDRNNLQVGDIVTFNKGTSTPVTHRILSIEERNGVKCYLQGPDITYRRDILGEDLGIGGSVESSSIITPDEVVGKVVTINGNPVKLIILGELIKMFRVPSALNIAKIVLVIAIVGLIIWTIISYVREKRTKTE